MNQLRQTIQKLIVDITIDHDTDTLEEVQEEYINAILDAVIEALPTTADIPQLTLDQLDGYTKAHFDFKNVLVAAKEDK